jgi:hypothetical protein
MSWWNYPTEAGTSQALSGVDPGGGQRQFLVLPSSCSSRPDFPFQLLSLLSALRFQLSAFQRFPSWPVEQRALGLLLAGGDFGVVPNGTGSSHKPALSHL